MLAKRIFVIGLGLTVCGFSNRAIHAQAASSTSDGVYTKAQAQRGNALYRDNCAKCHGDELKGSDSFPPLTGSAFTGDWIGQSLVALYDKIQTTMPDDDPGKLTRPQAADVLAFILSSNQFPVGKTELPTDADALQKIHIDAVPAKN